MKRFGIFALAFLFPTFVLAADFPRTLSLGSTGADVRELQKILNQDPATAVAVSGPGSAGSETEYFGLATKAAVVKFQEKYSTQILVPNSLSKGTGKVGPSTRFLLQTFSNPVASSSVRSVLIASSSSAIAANTNDADLGHLAEYWAAQKKVALEMHYSADQLAHMRAEIARLAATTTDLQSSFLKAVPAGGISEGTSLLGTLVALVESMIVPRHAVASLGAPFGGRLLTAVPCNGGVWNLFITPLPPLYPVLLSYVTGSELYLAHNIPVPLGIAIKGAYAPVPMAYCWIGIYPFPSQGMITPQVGSSLLPAI